MQAIRVFVVSLCVPLLAACSSMHIPTEGLASLASKKGSSEDTGPSKEMQAAYEKQVQQCADEFAQVRKGFDGSKNLQLSLASIGIIAGSVIVPTLAAKAAASKAAIAGWGGLSGAMNGAQLQLENSGASAFDVSEVYSAMRTEFKDANDEYANAKNESDRQKALNHMLLACKFRPLPSVKKVEAGG